MLMTFVDDMLRYVIEHLVWSQNLEMDVCRSPIVYVDFDGS